MSLPPSPARPLNVLRGQENGLKALTEFVGTFVFLFVISQAAVSGSELAPFAIGFALCTMVYMGGHWSGGHFNPAVSFGVWLQRRMGTTDFFMYILAQVVAGLLAFWLGWFITGKTVTLEPGAEYGATKALIVEMIFTMALVLVVLNVAVSKKTEGRGFYGLAIGLTIVTAVLVGGPVSGGAFNPAVGIGATAMHVWKDGGTWGSLWIPTVGPLLGAAVGGFIWTAQEGNAE